MYNKTATQYVTKEQKM